MKKPPSSLADATQLPENSSLGWDELGQLGFDNHSGEWSVVPITKKSSRLYTLFRKLLNRWK